MRGITVSACLLTAALLATPAIAEEEPEKMSFWMKKKLEYSQEILEGMTAGNFEQIGKSARSMNALGYLEKWVRANSSDYRAQLRIFQSANKQLIEMADEQNLDGTAAAYVQLTLSCVNCHKVVRDQAPADPGGKQ
jgi:cytochrome c556